MLTGDVEAAKASAALQALNQARTERDSIEKQAQQAEAQQHQSEDAEEGSRPSHRYLQRTDFSKIKIDRSFVARMTDGAHSDIVATIVALAKNLGMVAVAEGIETEEQLERLRALGPTSVQGFLFSSPLDEHAAGALLDDTLPSGPARGDAGGRVIRSTGRTP